MPPRKQSLTLGSSTPLSAMRAAHRDIHARQTRVVSRPCAARSTWGEETHWAVRQVDAYNIMLFHTLGFQFSSNRPDLSEDVAILELAAIRGINHRHLFGVLVPILQQCSNNS